jgi:hypothetical protein
MWIAGDYFGITTLCGEAIKQVMSCLSRMNAQGKLEELSKDVFEIMANHKSTKLEKCVLDVCFANRRVLMKDSKFRTKLCDGVSIQAHGDSFIAYTAKDEQFVANLMTEDGAIVDRVGPRLAVNLLFRACTGETLPGAEPVPFDDSIVAGKRDGLKRPILVTRPSTGGKRSRAS